MTVNELILKLGLIQDKFDLENAKIYVGCQGYTNINDTDNETHIILDKKGNLVIADSCMIEEIEYEYEL